MGGIKKPKLNGDQTIFDVENIEITYPLDDSGKYSYVFENKGTGIIYFNVDEKCTVANGKDIDGLIIENNTYDGMSLIGDAVGQHLLVIKFLSSMGMRE